MAGRVSSRLAYLTRDLRVIDRVLVKVSAEVIVEELLEQVGRDTGGDRALSGIGGGRYKLDVSVSPLSNPVGVRIRPQGKQSGMWTIVDKGTSAHEVGAKPRRKRQAATVRGSSRARAMKPGGVLRAGPWRVGGSRGKQTWSKGRDKGFERAVDAVREEFRRVVAG